MINAALTVLLHLTMTLLLVPHFARIDEIKNQQPVKQSKAVQNSDDPEAVRNLGLQLVDSKRFKEAIPYLQKAQQVSPSDQVVRVALIRAFLDAKADGEVQRLTSEFLVQKASDVALQVRLARMLKQGGYNELANRVLLEAVKSFPDSPVPHLELGLILLDAQNFENAAMEIGKAAQLDPLSPIYALQLGRVLLLWHHYSTANDYLLAVKERFDKLPEFRYEFAYATYGRKRYEEALTQTLDLIRDQPKMADAYYLLGNCYWALNDAPSAISGYQKAITLNGGNAGYYTALGTVLRSSGAWDEATSTLRKAVALNANNLEAKFELALCFEKKGDLGEAEHLLESINRADSTLPRAHSLLARVYLKQGKSADAQREAVEAKVLREKSLPIIERKSIPETQNLEL